MPATVNEVTVELKVMVKVSDSTSDEIIGGQVAIEAAKALLNELTYHNGLLVSVSDRDHRLVAEVTEVI